MEYLKKVGKTVQTQFETNRRILSYEEYLALFDKDPQRHARSAAQYACDMFDYFGTELVKNPGGEIRRFKLFDAPWDESEDRLVGQERVQNNIYRIISNFSKQGVVDRFILLHGPNGSSKSTISELIARGLEHYSMLEEGALYCFGWIFPSQKIIRTGIGFGGEQNQSTPLESYAYLEDEQIDTRLACEMRDHPLLLIPKSLRLEVLEPLMEKMN